MPEIKKCTKCGDPFPRTSQYFQKDKGYKDGLTAQCKTCTAKRMEKYNKKNKEKIASNKKEYYIKNKDAITERNLLYVKKNKLAIAERNRMYRLNNIDTYTQKDRLYYQNNRDSVIRSVMLYRRNNRENHRISDHKRKARIRKLPCTLTVEQWEQCKSYFEDKCAYCGKKSVLTHDHFVPLSKGGEYTKDNVMPSCRSCNSSKGQKEFTKWFSMQEYYTKERHEKILKYLGYEESKQQLTIF